MSKKNATNKLKCLCCERVKVSNVGNYYENNNPLFASEKVLVCKLCINKYIGESSSEGYVNRVISILSLLNRPFIHEQWVIRGEEWGKYVTQISSLTPFKDMNFEDSDFNSNYIKEKDIDSEDRFNNVNNTSYHITDEIILYWGRDYQDWEYEFLEDEKYKLMSSFECPDYGMEMLMRDICFVNLDIEKLRQDKKSDNSSKVSKLIETRGKLMNDAKMKPIQATGAEENDQVTFGTLIKKWENERPIPRPLDDEMKEYIDTFMVGHLAKMEGLENDATRKYDEALSEYTIDFSEINKNDEELDE